MNYKNYSLTNFSKWGWWEAFNLLDLEEPIIKHKQEKEIKKLIDKRIKDGI